MSSKRLTSAEFDTLTRAFGNYDALLIQGIAELRGNKSAKDQLTQVLNERERLHTVRLWVNYKQNYSLITRLWNSLKAITARIRTH